MFSVTTIPKPCSANPPEIKNNITKLKNAAPISVMKVQFCCSVIFYADSHIQPTQKSSFYLTNQPTHGLISKLFVLHRNINWFFHSPQRKRTEQYLPEQVGKFRHNSKNGTTNDHNGKSKVYPHNWLHKTTSPLRSQPKNDTTIKHGWLWKTPVWMNESWSE
jgi:hypothetical protein